MYNEPKNRSKIISQNPIALNEPTSYSNSNTRVLSSSASRTSLETKITKPVKNSVPEVSRPVTEPKVNKIVKTTPPSVKPNPAHLAVDGATPTEAQPNTFTVQIAAYFNENQLKEAMTEVKRDYENKQKIFVSRRKENNKFVYRILLGQFANRQLAVKYMNSIGVKGVVKDFDSMK